MDRTPLPYEIQLNSPMETLQGTKDNLISTQTNVWCGICRPASPQLVLAWCASEWCFQQKAQLATKFAAPPHEATKWLSSHESGGEHGESGGSRSLDARLRHPQGYSRHLVRQNFHGALLWAFTTAASHFPKQPCHDPPELAVHITRPPGPAVTALYSTLNSQSRSQNALWSECPLLKISARDLLHLRRAACSSS